MLYAIAAVLVLILDQWLKYWVTANIVLDSGSIELIPNLLHLVNIHNDGAAFSLLSGAGARWFFVALGIAVVILIIVALARGMIHGRFGRWCAVLAAAGALGNVIDRAAFGYVVDMFMVPPVKILQIFNVADIFITVGGILFCFYIIFGGDKEKKSAGKDDAKSEEAASAAPLAQEPKTETKAPVKERERAPEKARAKAPAKAQAKPRHEAETAQSKPTQTPAETAAPEKDAMDFSLDDIMDEFK